MTNETTKRLAPLLRKLRSRFADRAPYSAACADASQVEPVLCALVRALLEWNADERVAATAFARLCTCFVDLNEMRVCSHEEFVVALADHPAAADRAARLRACLADVYRREHTMSLAVLRDAPKREARHYLESLDGVPRAVAARIAHEVLEIHAIPVDDRLRDLLDREGVIHQGATPEHAAIELERAIPAADLKEAVTLLLAWAHVDGRTPDPRAKPANPAKGTPRNATKEPTKEQAKDSAKESAKNPAAEVSKAKAPARQGPKAKSAKAASTTRGRKK